VTVIRLRPPLPGSTSTWPTSPISSPHWRWWPSPGDHPEPDPRRRLHPRQGERPPRRSRRRAREARGPGHGDRRRSRHRTDPADELRGARLGTHHDHRLAMAFGVLGAAVPASRSTIPRWCRRAGPGSGTMLPRPSARIAVTVVAAFDVDGTLTTRDCVVPFMRTCGTARSRPGCSGTHVRARAPGAARPRRRQGGGHPQRPSQGLPTTIASGGAPGVRRRGGRRADARTTPWLACDGTESRATVVVLVSASFEVYLEPLACASRRRCRARHPHRGRADGVCTGRSRRSELPRRREGPPPARMARRTPRRSPPVEVWAYGDSRRRPRAAGRRRPLPSGRAAPSVTCHSRVGRCGSSACLDRSRAGSSARRAPSSGSRTSWCSPPPARPGCSTTPRARAHVLAFVAFCLAASGTYFWNDMLDVDADRAHPTKRRRPIAAGVVPLGRPGGGCRVAASAALGVAALTGRWQTVAIVAVYVVVTLAYSIWLKHVAVVDLVTIASGFVLRAAPARWPSTSRCRAGSCCASRSVRCSS
jgi:hypothetical protein